MQAQIYACVSSCIFKHVNIPPSTTRLVLSEGKIASMCMCNWGSGGGGRNGSGWASKVEVINQDLLSLFPSNRIIRDKQVRVLHVRQVSGGRKIPRL